MKLVGATLASLFGVAACSSNPIVQTRTVTVYAPAACQPAAGSAFALFQPLGDFEAPQNPPSVLLTNVNVGAVLAGFPADTMELVADVTDATSAHWAAHALLASTGDVNLLALPSGAPCAFTDTIGARTGAVVGAIDEGHALVVGGAPATEGGAIPATALIDLTQGTVATLPVGLLTPRTEATITPWSGGAVVAGGVSPQSAGGGTLASFEIYDSSLGDFNPQQIGTLSQPRAQHGAAVLASGETLLVGGVDANNAILGSMEAIDPSTSSARTAGLAQLASPRANPVVMRLASGEILVAGGVDAAGAPVSMLEWFPPAASPSVVQPQDLVASPNEAFIPLSAGGALAVIAGVTANVWVISADHSLLPATPIEGALTNPQLFAGVGGAAILWTGELWLEWQPWAGAFRALASAPIGSPGPTGDPIASPEPGLGAWTDGANVYALRSGVRGPYATTPDILFTDTSTASFAPYAAPDRLVSSDTLAFDSMNGLTLAPNASVFVTDATYASFALDLQTPTANPPDIILRDDAGNETVLGSVSIGSTACSFTPGKTLHVERDGDGAVSWSVDGGALVACGSLTLAPRVSIGVRGAGSNGSVVQSIQVTRT